MKITVDYPVEEHEELPALLGTLLEDADGALDKLEIVPSETPVYRVSIDGKVIFESETGFSVNEIEEAMEEMEG